MKYGVIIAPRVNGENIIEYLKDGFGISVFNLKYFWVTEAALMTIYLIFRNIVTMLNKLVILVADKNRKLCTLRTPDSSSFIG